MSDFDFSWDNLKAQLPNNTFIQKQNFNDSRFWKLSRDENDNGTAIIRLLPDPEKIPIVKIFEHSIKIFNKQTGKYRYYIQPSPSSIGLPCPASEEWARLNALGTEEAKELAKKFKRRIQYITNIYVIKDPANPENEGKVFLWKFGIRLMDKFRTVLEPSETDKAMGVKRIELFDFKKGSNILLKAKKLAGFINYDDTSIQAPSTFCNSEEAIRIWKSTYNLREFLDPSYYLDYNELKDKLDWVLGRKEANKNNSNQELDKILDQQKVEEQPSKNQQNEENQNFKENEENQGSKENEDDIDLDFLDDLE